MGRIAQSNVSAPSGDEERAGQAPDRVTVSPDGKFFVPPGPGRALLLTAADLPGRRLPDAVVRFELPAEPDEAAGAALRAGVIAAGRPVVADVRAGRPPDAIVAALDVGAAGAIVDTGDATADRALVEAAGRAEAERRAALPLCTAVVCAYNAAEYLDACLASLSALDHPRFEVLVCDDGSTDGSAAIAARHPVRLLELPHRGLSAARNAGLAAAEGEVVAFIDADAEADPHWLAAVWRTLDRTGATATGGPNLPFPDAGWQERAVSGSPGAAIPVVNPDGSCTHLAGCNLAVRRGFGLRIGGFDERYSSSHDDVDFCVRLTDAGGSLVFSPAASIRHHRRKTIAAYLRQQRSYGANSSQDINRHKAMIPKPQRTLLERLDPRRPRYVFAGPQGRQLYTLTSRPLHVGLPAKLLLGLLGPAIALFPPAVATRRLRAWAAGTAAALGGLWAVVAWRAPAFAPGNGWRAVRQHAATGLLWLVQPLVHRLGEWQAQRRR